ncbi:hypothetical protein COU57_03000 [Candidatus Pacearchaeota archaeon CG10_big_fil_rev_8_21_14_0_10_32_14]|nr:MAG: hypothetical protein COU57_03000 [Candidatus Pacearchaeota archaeon CG10_big_fil_rev_8_21_14_0_10_32_14]
MEFSGEIERVVFELEKYPFEDYYFHDYRVPRFSNANLLDFLVRAKMPQYIISPPTKEFGNQQEYVCGYLGLKYEGPELKEVEMIEKSEFMDVCVVLDTMYNKVLYEVWKRELLDFKGNYDWKMQVVDMKVDRFVEKELPKIKRRWKRNSKDRGVRKKENNQIGNLSLIIK